MLSRELAEKVLKELAVSMYEYCKNKDMSDEESTGRSMRLYNHSLVVGKIAEKIGREIGLNADRCYVCGLLHDMGRFDMNRCHGLVGYEMAMENKNPELAKICLTHSFSKNQKFAKHEFPDNEYKEKDMEKVKKILSFIEYNDYDLLIRLCDFMAIGETTYSNTIEDRLIELRDRYKIPKDEYDELKKELYEIKAYFDEKLGYDLYELLELRIINLDKKDNI